MFMPRVFIITSFAWALAACNGTPPHGENWTVLAPSTAPKVMHQCSRGTPAGVDGAWSVSAQTAAQIEQDIGQLKKMTGTGDVPAAAKWKPETYFRQYLGITIQGKQYVYINAYHLWPQEKRSDEALFDKPILICDGGYNAWGAVYDPQTHQFSQLEFNGAI